MSTKLPSRVFKTAWFTRAARKARIGDGELCVAIQQVMAGQADDLGGGAGGVQEAGRCIRADDSGRGEHRVAQRRPTGDL
ncbi:MAG: type II toxin-antitoxin system RelE/ParE family toxin [Burkholderiaceae bacterium]|nr:type II toxin-antitoxin system RelE/ParE family toxin [Burkholderiaceae bacterium]